MLIDSHCHLQHFPLDERLRALERARERGVLGFLIPAVRLEEAEELLAFAEAEEGVWCALGVHPHEAASWREGDEERLRGLLAHPRAVAVGECGLDFFYDHAPRDVQERVFAAQLRVAAETGLPAVVHNRDSNERMLAVVSRPELARARCDFHSFAGGIEMAKALDGRGAGHVFGVSGMVTFPKADDVRAAFAALPADRLLVETDTPYLAPVPFRGKPNEPAHVVEIAARLARELGREPEAIAAQTTATFFRFFGKAAGGDPRHLREAETKRP
jgi:TatD DNase family protein